MDAFELLPFGFMGIGLFLLIFYGVWLYRTLISTEEQVEENRITLLGGWSGGIAFIACGMLLVLPPNLFFWVIPSAVVLLLSWYLLYFTLHSLLRSVERDKSSS